MSVGCSLGPGPYLPWLITPTRLGLGWFVDSTLSGGAPGGAGGREEPWAAPHSMGLTEIWMSMGQEYERALKYVRGLLQTEPQNNQARELERLIDKAMKKGDPLPQSG